MVGPPNWLILQCDRAALCRIGCVQHPFAVLGQFIDLYLQSVVTGAVPNFLSRGFLRVQLSQMLIHVEEKRTFLWREHDCPISGLIDLD
jgi:hypothetical protein